jgi:hypothetical protein
VSSPFLYLNRPIWFNPTAVMLRQTLGPTRSLSIQLRWKYLASSSLLGSSRAPWLHTMTTPSTSGHLRRRPPPSPRRWNSSSVVPNPKAPKSQALSQSPTCFLASGRRQICAAMNLVRTGDSPEGHRTRHTWSCKSARGSTQTAGGCGSGGKATREGSNGSQLCTVM